MELARDMSSEPNTEAQTNMSTVTCCSSLILLASDNIAISQVDRGVLLPNTSWLFVALLPMLNYP